MNKLKSILKIMIKPYTWFRTTRTRNKMFTILGLIIVVILVLRQMNKANSQPKYVIAKVSRKTITALISETGNVNTAGRVDVYSSSTGIIEEIYINDSEEVALNQELFKVRSTATDQEKAAAYAAYVSALNSRNIAVQNKPLYQAQLESARKAVIDASNAVNEMTDNRNNGRNNPATKKTYTQEEIDSINSALTSARQNFSSLEQKYKDADTAIQSGAASLSSAWLTYQATQNLVVKAPAAGTVANFSSKIGDKVTASSGNVAASTSPVLTIANLYDYSIKLALNEVDVPKVKVGQTAEITIDAIPGKTFKGEVIHVDSVGTNSQGVITYNVVLNIMNPTDVIKPAMTANAEIIVAKSQDVLTVPNSAIKPYQGKKAVQVLDTKTKKPKYIPVEVGIKSPERTEIKRGVAEGTEVITAIKNGSAAAVTPAN